MARIDALYLEDPCSGSRRVVECLASECIPISHDRERNLMRRRWLGAIYQKPHTTVPDAQSKRFPCLVELKQFRAADQIWATDINAIPPQKGFFYLEAIVDLCFRNVLSWKLFNRHDTEFCLDDLEIPLGRWSQAKDLNSDLGCQFTSFDFVSRLPAEKIRISWSGGSAAATSTSWRNGCGAQSSR